MSKSIYFDRLTTQIHFPCYAFGFVHIIVPFFSVSLDFLCSFFHTVFVGDGFGCHFRINSIISKRFLSTCPTSLHHKISGKWVFPWENNEKNAQNVDQLLVRHRNHHPDKLIECHSDWERLVFMKTEDLLKCQSALLVYYRKLSSHQPRIRFWHFCFFIDFFFENVETR